MKTMVALATSDEVIALAFSGVAQITPEAISHTKIIATQERFIRPVMGADLYDELLDGGHPEFVTAYIKPALAYYVRSGIIPDLSISVGNMGAATLYTDYQKPASDKQRTLTIEQARSDGDALLRRAIRYVETHLDEFPNYCAEVNIKNSTSIHGGIIL